jgi:hypothetical protein
MNSNTYFFNDYLEYEKGKNEKFCKAIKVVEIDPRG